LADELLAERGEWVRLAGLREQRRDFSRAAEAREKAGDLAKAAADWRRAGNEAAVVALAERTAVGALAKGDRIGAAETFARFHLYGRAAELALPDRPERAHHWYSRGGLDGEALALAQKESRRALAAGRLADAAQWLEKAGDGALAAETYERAERWEGALRLREQLGQWELAAACCAHLGAFERAAEYLRRAGQNEAAQEAERRGTNPRPRA